jgi:hypothetical protein
MMRRRMVWVLALAVGAMAVGGTGSAFGDIKDLQKRFENPPDDARMMVRWWWFGPAVTKEGIERELKAMKAGGIGGVEVQCTYPLALDGGTGESAVKNLKFLSPEHLEMLGFAAAKCKELGLRMDLTLGSGWPYGGPMFTAEEGAGTLEMVPASVQPGEKTVKVPPLRGSGAAQRPIPGERKVVAAFAGPAALTMGGGGRGGRGRGGPGDVDLSKMQEVAVENGEAKLPEGFNGGEVVFFVDGRTGMQVKRPAFGAQGLVIDHLSEKVVDKFINEVAEPAINACGANVPHAIFCDSLEVQGENWTDDFLTEFQKRRGYDLKPLLPALVGNVGEKTEGVRYDYGKTITELFNERFNAKFTALAKKHGTRFRIQGYGSPPAGLESYAYADLPEGEAGGNGTWWNFRATRYASSASHLMGVPVASSETFTWLHTAPFRATPTDIKGEVDTHFLDGINQVICHGWPYTGNGAKYPGWSFYAAAVFDEKNPWYVAMPEIAKYVQRASAMLREGQPANDIALYLPDSDVWAKAGVGYSSMNAAWSGQSGILGEILGAGYNVDGWDDGMLAMKGKVEEGKLAFGDVKYRAVVLNGVERMPLATAEKLGAFAKEGGIVMAVGRVPSVVPGLKATAEDQARLKEIMEGVFKGAGAQGILVENEKAFAEAFGKRLPPDMKVTPAAEMVGFVHRHTADGEVYFVTNTGNQKQKVQAKFRPAHAGVAGVLPHAELWDPLTGEVREASSRVAFDEPVELELQPLESVFVVIAPRELPKAAAAVAAKAVDLSGGWTVSFGEKKVPMEKLGSWTEVDGEKNYSGVGVYEKTVNATAEMTKGAWAISFGEAKAAAPAGGGRGGNGYVAQVDAPVRDAAVVYVNGKRAGAAWCPPYRVDVSGLLKEGENAIRIEVGNTAVNALAATGFPNYDYKGVTEKYGNRFQPQGVQLLSVPLPSGLLGPVVLEPVGK